MPNAIRIPVTSQTSQERAKAARVSPQTVPEYLKYQAAVVKLAEAQREHAAARAAWEAISKPTKVRKS